MKITAVDLETTGLNPKRCQILEIGLAIFDFQNPQHQNCSIEELPTFSTYVFNSDNSIQGEYYAINMNQKIIERILHREDPEISKLYDFCPIEQLTTKVSNFLQQHYQPEEQIILAGKCHDALDIPFLKQHSKLWETNNFHFKIVEPAMLFFDPNQDQEPPGLETCLKRAGINKKVTHNALDDALDVIRLLRSKFESDH